MKKFSLFTALIVCLVAITTSATAQEFTTEPRQTHSLQPEALPRNAVVYHHEFALSYGYLTTFDIVSVQNYRHFKMDILANYYHTVASYRGAFSLAYKYRFNKVASLGATYAFYSYQGRAYEQKVMMAKEHIGYHTLAMECDFRYLTRKAVTLYSTIAVATTVGVRTERKVGGVVVNRDSQALGSFHISLIGVKVGSYRAGGLIEYGIGYKGLVNVGGYVRF
jgi:hypothetical protein